PLAPIRVIRGFLLLFQLSAFRFSPPLFISAFCFQLSAFPIPRTRHNPQNTVSLFKSEQIKDEFREHHTSSPAYFCRVQETRLPPGGSAYTPVDRKRKRV
ncbi:MAG: hypothetical protein R6V03_00005, partial [Kiritimatiellia bacterium]